MLRPFIIAAAAIGLGGAYAQEPFGFGPPQVLHDAALLESYPTMGLDVATDGAGSWTILEMCCSTRGENNFRTYQVRTITSATNGASWSEPALLGLGAEFDEGFGIAMAAAADGRFISLWSDAAEETTHVVQSTSTNAGLTWTTDGILNTGPNVRDLETDGASTWMFSSTNDFSFETPIGHRPLMRTTDAGATWTELDFPTGPTPASPLRLATDRHGTWVAVSVEGELEYVGPGNNKQAENRWAVQLRMWRSTDNGKSWTAPVDLRATLSDETFPSRNAIATDGKGNWIATWLEAPHDELSAPTIRYTSRSTTNGEGWSTPAEVALAPIEYVFDSSIVADSAGNWFVSGIGRPDPEETSYALYVGHSTDLGATWDVVRIFEDTPYTDFRSIRIEAGGDGRLVLAAYAKRETEAAPRGQWDTIVCISDAFAVPGGTPIQCAASRTASDPNALADLALIAIVLGCLATSRRHGWGKRRPH